jgi:signal peptidase I/conjugal transfer pilin signal peptidase TrbI
MKRALNWKVLTLLALIGVIGTLIPGRFCVTLTPSVKYRLFVLDRDLSQVKNGDYVLVSLDVGRLGNLPLPEGVREGETVRAVKRVACAEGELLRVAGRDFFCDDEPVGRAKERSLKGVSLTPFVFSGPVPEGWVFLSGDHPDSFDSRYFGFVDKKTLRAWARPIW